MTASNVRIGIVELDAHGSRPIAVTERLTDLLANRAEDISEAIRQSCQIAQKALSDVGSNDTWRATSLQASFGITVAAEGTVLVAKGSAEASFEVVVTIERPAEAQR